MSDFYNKFESQEKQIKSLQEALESISKLNKSTEEENQKLKKLLSEEKESKKKLEEQISKLKQLVESQQTRIDTINYIDRLNNAQSDRIRALENELLFETSKKEEKNNELKLTTELGLTKIKKKSLELLKQIKNDYDRAFHENLNTSNKVTMLHNSELISELCHQSIQIEELIKNKMNLEGEIKNLKFDISIHNQIEKLLKTSKNKYQKMVSNRFTNPNSTVFSQDNSHEDHFNQNQMIQNLKKNSLSNKLSRQKLIKKINESSILQSKDNSVNFEGKIKTLENEINKSKMKYCDIKVSYDVLAEKLKNFETKSTNFFNLIDDGIKKIISDCKCIPFKEKINIEKFEMLDFDMLSKEQRYTILSELMNHLKPLLSNEVIINKEKNSKNSINSKLFGIKSNKSFIVKTPTNLMKTGSHIFKIFEKNAMNTLYSSSQKTSFSERTITK